MATLIDELAALRQQLATITAERDALYSMAYTDTLTGIANRAALYNDSPSNGILALCDLNGFKAVNDTHGHDAGDRVLIDFATFLQGLDGVAYRLGGDEFVLVTTNPDALAAVRSWSHPVYGCTTSVGTAAITALAEALAEADAAMYADKTARRQSCRPAGRMATAVTR